MIGNKIADKITSISKKPVKELPNNDEIEKDVEINDGSRGTYTSNSIKFKTKMLRSNLCDYADAYILARETITITGEGDDAAARQADKRDKGVIFKNCAPFIECISRINNAGIVNAKDIDNVIPM